MKYSPFEVSEIYFGLSYTALIKWKMKNEMNIHEEDIRNQWWLGNKVKLKTSFGKIIWTL